MFSPATSWGPGSLLGANVDKHVSATVDLVVKRSLNPDFARAHLPVIFALQETRSWDVQNLSPHRVCPLSGSKPRPTTLVVPDRFGKTQRSWRSEERCIVVLFGSVMVMSVYAPDSGKDL